MAFDIDRRQFVKSSGALLAIAPIAGCSGNGNGDDGNGDADANGDDGNGDGDIDEWLADVENYDGSVADETGQDEITIINGEVDGADQQYVFDPPAVEVDAGTTVVWEWAGDDSHSVTDDDGDFDSGIIDGDGETFEYTFDEAGTYLYYCQPHRSLNQKGAVIVE